MSRWRGTRLLLGLTLRQAWALRRQPALLLIPLVPVIAFVSMAGRLRHPPLGGGVLEAAWASMVLALAVAMGCIGIIRVAPADRAWLHCAPFSRRDLMRTDVLAHVVLWAVLGALVALMAALFGGIPHVLRMTALGASLGVAFGGIAACLGLCLHRLHDGVRRRMGLAVALVGVVPFMFAATGGWRGHTLPDFVPMPGRVFTGIALGEGWRDALPGLAISVACLAAAMVLAHVIPVDLRRSAGEDASPSAVMDRHVVESAPAATPPRRRAPMARWLGRAGVLLPTRWLALRNALKASGVVILVAGVGTILLPARDVVGPRGSMFRVMASFLLPAILAVVGLVLAGGRMAAQVSQPESLEWMRSLPLAPRHFMLANVLLPAATMLPLLAVPALLLMRVGPSRFAAIGLVIACCVVVSAASFTRMPVQMLAFVMAGMIHVVAVQLVSSAMRNGVLRSYKGAGMVAITILVTIVLLLRAWHVERRRLPLTSPVSQSG